MNIGLRVKELRKQLGLTQAEFAKKANISRTYLSDVENNRYNPSIDTLQNIANHLEVPLSDFFDTSTDNERKTIDDINKIVEKNKIETIAAHLDAEEFTDADLEDIEEFIKYVASRKKKRE
ncbi:helix-turn-helix domain-containing protein [Alkaliphilus sp. B6464]|uniref:helix-turn-helix domain-containing protein n=1 Tax=Alkaliphilus sp. B6464 TaxID=2731219 RepID=UPI001BAB4319|nr:helix-turn-helix transcriptional regulator [Alkaliphilus sp. B6464]QUH21462.1 helix-turn-helix transcriptional regulator [Alkaliphilus sp. B6464]